MVNSYTLEEATSCTNEKEKKRLCKDLSVFLYLCSWVAHHFFYYFISFQLLIALSLSSRVSVVSMLVFVLCCDSGWDTGGVRWSRHQKTDEYEGHLHWGHLRHLSDREQRAKDTLCSFGTQLSEHQKWSRFSPVTICIMMFQNISTSIFRSSHNLDAWRHTWGKINPAENNRISF